MSHRRKHVSQALLQDASPEVLAGQRILRVCEHRGSNMLEVCVRGCLLGVLSCFTC